MGWLLIAALRFAITRSLNNDVTIDLVPLFAFPREMLYPSYADFVCFPSLSFLSGPEEG